MGIVGDADAARLSNSLQPRRDVDAVTKDIVFIDDDVADMNADAEFDPEFLRNTGVLFGHAALDLDGTASCVHGAGELDQHAVSGGLDDVSAMLGDGGIDERFPERLELRQRAFLVAAHQTAIAGDICR